MEMQKRTNRIDGEHRPLPLGQTRFFLILVIYSNSKLFNKRKPKKKKKNPLGAFQTVEESNQMKYVVERQKTREFDREESKGNT